MTEWTVNNKLNDWYQKRYHIKLPKKYETKSEIYFGGSSFSPASLFSSTAIGIWLDPSDLSTMFSDRAGTTPVAAPGTTVGLRLDKSKGLVLGSELVVNGGFASGSTGYVEVLNGTISYASQTMAATGTTGNTGVYQDVTVTANRSYQVSWQQVSGTDRRAGIYDGAGFGTPLYTSNDTITGTRTVVVRPTTTTIRVYLSTPAGATAQFDNISVRELAGNHAVAPTDAARPIYGVEPKGGRRNLLTFTHDLTNTTNWPNGPVLLGSRSGAGVSVSDPEGYAYISRTAASNTVVSGVTYTASVTVVCDQTISNVPIRFGSGYGVSQFALVNMVVGVPQRVNLTATATGSGPISAEFGIDARNGVVPGGSNATGYTVTFSDPQLETGSTATPYQRVLSAYDITESGVPTCHYVQYDGSDDSMSTSAIDFTATDKMSVFAGVRKLSDANITALLELSSNSSSINGSFGLFAPRTAAAGNYGTHLLGTSTSEYVTASSFAAPSSTVLSGLYDIAQSAATDEQKIRLNGIQQTLTSAGAFGPSGTGNFGNHPLFFGRRGNASLPFNGRDYGILVVGKAASAGEITDTETWLAARTAQVTI